MSSESVACGNCTQQTHRQPLCVCCNNEELERENRLLAELATLREENALLRQQLAEARQVADIEATIAATGGSKVDGL